MRVEGPPGENVFGLESVHEGRLTALLAELVDGHGRMETAELLGVNYKTVARSMDAGRLSVRLRQTLLGVLLTRADQEAERQRERMGMLGRRAEELESAVEAVRSSAAAEIEALQREHEQAVQGLERRLERLESRNGTAAATGAAEGRGTVTAGGSKAAGRRPAARSTVERRYPELVTQEPAPDDGEVYGAAWPLVDEWRGLRAGHRAGGKGLAWAVVEERVLELEVALLEEHGLTLPPEKEPVRGIWRESRLGWRKRALEDARRERAKAEQRRTLRRVLSLGLWWE